MATIDEIFAAMPEEAAEGGREYLVIDPETRTITVPESERIFGVEADTDAARKYFLCPRYVGDNLDLASMFLTVNYRNANGDEDGYLVEDVEIQGDYVTFSWQLWPNVVAYKGAVQFAVCADLPNTTHRRGPDWNTTLAAGEVLEGLDPDRGDVEGETSDVVTQLRAETAAQTAAVEATGAAQVQNVKNEGSAQVNTVKATGAQTEADALAAIKAQGEATLATIPAEYADLAAQVDKLTRDRAAAIVCQAEGEVLQITDAGNDPLQGLRIFGKTEQVKTTGKNLLQSEAQSGAVYGVTFYVHEDGRVHAVGTASQAAYLTLAGGYAATKAPVPDWLVPGQQYTISDAGLYLYGEDGKQTSFSDMSFTMPEGYAYYGIFIRIGASVAVNKTYYPMVNAGTEALPWEPYSGGMAAPCPDWPVELQSVQGPVVRVCDTNLCNLPDMAASEISGITWTYKDGAAIANGTATAQSNVAPGKCPLNLLPGTYTVSGGDNGIYVIVTVQRGNLREYYTSKKGQPVTFETISGDVLYLYTQAPNGTTAENVTVYPMVNAGAEALPWEPYKEHQALEITTPGSLPGIPVASGGNYTDANGQQWIADEVDLARGVYVQRVGQIVFDDSQSYHINAYQQGFGYYVYGCTMAGASYSEAPVLADKLNFKPWGYWNLESGGDLICYEAYSFYIYLRDQSIQTVEAFQEYLAANPITALYILAAPMETALTDAEIQAYLALQSYKPTTTVLNDAGAHMVLEYAADPKTYIDNKLAALIAANT